VGREPWASRGPWRQAPGGVLLLRKPPSPLPPPPPPGPSFVFSVLPFSPSRRPSAGSPAVIVDKKAAIFRNTPSLCLTDCPRFRPLVPRYTTPFTTYFLPALICCTFCFSLARPTKLLIPLSPSLQSASTRSSSDCALSSPIPLAPFRPLRPFCCATHQPAMGGPRNAAKVHNAAD
jgi:hypothetical protein